MGGGRTINQTIGPIVNVFGGWPKRTSFHRGNWGETLCRNRPDSHLARVARQRNTIKRLPLRSSKRPLFLYIFF